MPQHPSQRSQNLPDKMENVLDSVGSILPHSYYQGGRKRTVDQLLDDMLEMQHTHEQVIAKAMACYRQQMSEIKKALTLCAHLVKR